MSLAHLLLIMGYKLLKILELDYPMFQFSIIEKHVGIHALAFHFHLAAKLQIFPQILANISSMYGT